MLSFSLVVFETSFDDGVLLDQCYSQRLLEMARQVWEVAELGQLELE